MKRFRLSVFNHHQYPLISIEEVRDKERKDCITLNPDFLFKLFPQRPLPAQFQVFLLSVGKRRGVRVSYWGRVEFKLSDIVTNGRRARNKRLRERERGHASPVHPCAHYFQVPAVLRRLLRFRLIVISGIKVKDGLLHGVHFQFPR